MRYLQKTINLWETTNTYELKFSSFLIGIYTYSIFKRR